MKLSSSSPKGYTYTLEQIKGKLGPIIRKLNLKAPIHFSTSDIQIVHWSLLSGLSYEEMTRESQQIIDQIIPEHRNEFKKSFLSSMEQELDRLSDLSSGAIPRLSGLPYLQGMRNFRNKLREVGNDYEELKDIVDTTLTMQKQTDTSWSKISENIYARFVTEGRFGDIGFIQVRVLPEAGRIVNSESQEKYSLDLASLVANPNDSVIQPLSFTPLFRIGGAVTTPHLVENSRATALLVTLSLAFYPMSWDDFFKLEKFLQDIDDKNVKKEIEKGRATLRKEHDELENPLKEAGIISGKDKKHSKEKKETREYRKRGGTEQLNKDFDKIPGERATAQDGTEVKHLPDGTTVIKSPGSNHGPTLEVQPPKYSSKYPDPRIRVKVRYVWIN
jgi:hypothetical protein